MALLMLPRVVLTHLKAGFRVLRPDPVMIGWWTQPALPTPVKQRRPSLTTVLAGWKLRCAKVAISARRKPFTRRNFKRIGLPSGEPLLKLHLVARHRVQTRRNSRMFLFCTTPRWLRIVRNQEFLSLTWEPS